MAEETSRTNVLLEDIQQNIQVLAECYVAQTAKLESFDHRLTNLEATTGRIEMRVGVLETKVDKLETKVDNLESFARDAQHRLTGLEDVVVESRGRLVRIESHLGLHASHRAPARRANRPASQPSRPASRTTRSKKR